MTPNFDSLLYNILAFSTSLPPTPILLHTGEETRQAKERGRRLTRDPCLGEPCTRWHGARAANGPVPQA